MKGYLTVTNIIIVILVIIGLVWLIYTIWRNYKINKINTWPKTIANVISVNIRPAGTLWQQAPTVVYNYTVGNKNYHSNNIIYGGSYSFNNVNIRSIINGVYAGSSIPIYYNPKNPNESYIFNGTKNYLGIVLSLIVLLIAGYLGYHHNTSLYKKNTVTVTSQTNKLSETPNEIPSDPGGPIIYITPGAKNLSRYHGFY